MLLALFILHLMGLDQPEKDFNPKPSFILDGHAVKTNDMTHDHFRYAILSPSKMKLIQGPVSSDVQKRASLMMTSYLMT